jgi:hypothetical protein
MALELNMVKQSLSMSTEFYWLRTLCKRLASVIRTTSFHMFHGKRETLVEMTASCSRKILEGVVNSLQDASVHILTFILRGMHSEFWWESQKERGH